MILSRGAILGFIAILLLPTRGLAAGDWSDSGIVGPKYPKILSQIAHWHAQFPRLTRLIDYGHSVEGRPLRMLVAMKRGHFASRPALLLSGSTHGDEYLHLEDRLPLALLRESRHPGPVKRFLDNGGAFVFIPILNPDGYASRSRENARGVDLNRDWDLAPAGFKGFSQVETRALRRELDALRRPPYRLRYEISVDYHCCAGALLYPWAYETRAIPAADLARHQAIAQLASQLLKIDTGPTGEILGYFPVGTTKDYYYDRYSMLAFTYEGRYGVEDSFFDKHLQWWNQMVSFVNREQVGALYSKQNHKQHHPFFHLADE